MQTVGQMAHFRPQIGEEEEKAVEGKSVDWKTSSLSVCVNLHGSWFEKL